MCPNFYFMIKVCESCKKEFVFRGRGFKRNSHVKFCSPKCHGEYLKGKPSPSLGKSWSEESRKKIRGRPSPRKGLSFPQVSSRMMGNKNPAWKGGVSRLQDIIRNSNKYSEWRLMVFGRDNFTCQECGLRGVYLEAHHIKQFSAILEKNNIKSMEDAYNCPELWDLKNGITLCKECHRG